MSFDLLAPHYDWMEALSAGPRLQRCRTAWLDSLAGARRILSVGEGHGRFALACAQRFPAAQLTCVDASAAMLARAQARMAREGPPGARVDWIVAPLPGWAPPQGAQYDAIVTDFFLDCFRPDQLASIIPALARGAAPRATWLVADFSLPAAGAARWRARAVHAIMYSFFRVVTRLPARRLTAPDPYLAAQGFRLAGRREFEWGLLRSDCWSRG